MINEEEEAEKCARLRELGCRLFTDYREMLHTFGAQADICFIPTGIHLHEPMTIAALQQGMNVFVEKPAAATIDEVRHMQRVERETGRFVAVGYQSMYALETMIMKQMILDGRLGRITSIKTSCFWPRDRAYYRRNEWAGKLRLPSRRWILDSPFNNAAAHGLNMICFLAGRELTCRAQLRSITAELYKANDIEGPDTACLEIETVEGPRLYFYATHACRRSRDPLIEVHGERATLTWEHHRSLTLRDHAGRSESFQVQPEHPRDYVLRTLSARLSDPNVFVCDLELAAAQTVCVNGAHESSRLMPIPHRYLRHESNLTAIDGIEDLIDRSYAAELPFSAIGAPWAQPGERVSLTAYDHFRGPRCTPS